MSPIPDTRASLIVRLPNADDAAAWKEFAEIYEPFVYQYARRRGLQDCDARELVQNVFLGVAKAVRRWRPDPDQARFRTWLFRIARNQLLTRLSGREHEQSLDSDAWKNLAAPVGSELSSSAEQLAYRREVFHWASIRVQRTVKPATWQAFWQTSFVGRPVDDVARQLGVARGFVYVARSRVIQKLREEIQRFLDESDRVPEKGSDPGND
jgi:RNA polymerase sigma-70 factor (ECF subfamily)